MIINLAQISNKDMDKDKRKKCGCGRLKKKDVVSSGDALEIMGNNLTKAYISGRSISLETHQTQLWRRYSNKFSN